MSHFKKRLAEGKAFEDLSVSFLTEEFDGYQIERDEDYQTNHNSTNGPRIEIEGTEYIIPDFILTNENTRILVDAKHKSSPMDLDDEECFSLDRNKFDDYIALGEIWDAEVYLLFGDERSGKMYLFDANQPSYFRELSMNGRHNPKTNCPIFKLTENVNSVDFPS